MQYYYQEQSVSRALDEAEFWKHQEIEHTSVIQLVTPNLEENYVEGLNLFEQMFSATHAELVKYIESVTRSGGRYSNTLNNEMLQVIKAAVRQSENFVEYLTEMLRESQAVQANSASQTVINHIIRESQYFIGIDQLILAKA